MATRPTDILLRQSRDYVTQNIIIREATEDDIPRMIELGEIMFLESRYSRKGYTFDKGKVFYFFQGMVNDKEANILILAESKGKIIGGFGCVISPQWFCDGIIANDLFLFVEPNERGFNTGEVLIRSFIERAKAMGVNTIMMINSTGVKTKAVGKLFERCGLTQICGCYCLEL